LEESQLSRSASEPLIKSKTEPVITLRMAIRTSRFWTLWFMLFSGIFYGIYIASEFKNLTTPLIDD
jgi:hypothetical protein